MPQQEHGRRQSQKGNLCGLDHQHTQHPRAQRDKKRGGGGTGKDRQRHTKDRTCAHVRCGSELNLDFGNNLAATWWLRSICGGRKGAFLHLLFRSGLKSLPSTGLAALQPVRVTFVNRDTVAAGALGTASAPHTGRTAVSRTWRGVIHNPCKREAGAGGGGGSGMAHIAQRQWGMNNSSTSQQQQPHLATRCSDRGVRAPPLPLSRPNIPPGGPPHDMVALGKDPLQRRTGQVAGEQAPKIVRNGACVSPAPGSRPQHSTMPPGYDLHGRDYFTLLAYE